MMKMLPYVLVSDTQTRPLMFCCSTRPVAEAQATFIVVRAPVMLLTLLRPLFNPPDEAASGIFILDLL